MSEITSTVPRQDWVDEPISEVGQMSQWKLMRLRFMRNKLAMIGFFGLVVMYLIVAFAGFLAPNHYMTQNQDYAWGPPSKITFINTEGKLTLRPHMYEIKSVLDPAQFRFVFDVDENVRIPIYFFVRGDEYTLFGRFTSNVHLFGVKDGHRIYPFGADGLGRDMFARTLQGGQISMTVGLVGVSLSIILGSIMGTVSGYYGGLTDDIMQRVIEVIMAFPTVPLWAALAAALPPLSESFTALHRYFLITIILSLVTWTGLARQLRQGHVVQPGRFYAGGSGGRRLGCAHHLCAYVTQRSQPHHCGGRAGHPRHDPG